MKTQSVLFVVITILFPRGSLPAQDAGHKPNILWVITDDQRPDSIAAFNRIRRGDANSSLGQVLSPNIDRLAAIGTTFINTFNQNPSCAPSRTSMHTGRYSHKTGVYGFEYYNPIGMPHWKPMVPEILRDRAGYQTVTVGKLGIRDQHFANKNNPNGPLLYQTDLGYRNEFAAQGLVDWHPERKWSGGKPGPRTETFFFPDGTRLLWPEDSQTTRNDAEAIRKRLDVFRAYRPGEDRGLGEILGGMNPQPSDGTRDATFVRALLDHLSHANESYTDVLGREQNGPDSQRPLFIHCGFEFPHTPVLPPAEFREKFARLHYELPEFSPEELAGFPPQIVKAFKNWQSDHFTDAEKQQMVADYYAYCAYGDRLVGKLVDGFIAYSEKYSRPWLVLYVCGDNGWKLNEHGMVSKFLHYDRDLNNPIIVVSSDGERFPARKVVTDFACFVDMAPTFLATAGIDVSTPDYDYLDGRDLAKTTAAAVPARDYIIAEPTWVTGPRAVIRTNDYKFAMRMRPQSGNAVIPATAGKNIDWAIQAELRDIEPMLFDLRVDPAEIHNVAFEKRYRPVVDKLRTKLQNIVLGDGRVEIAWTKTGGGAVHSSNFAPGADDGRIDLCAISTGSEKTSKVRVPRIASDYVNVYQPAGAVFPGPDAAELIAGEFYEDWVPNDHCFVTDDTGRWHAFGITHPLTDVSHVHAGEYMSFHAAAPPGTLKEVLRIASWNDLPKVLPPSERPGEIPANHAPWILRREGLYHMVYGPTPIRYAVSRDLRKWTPMGRLRGAPSGRDPHVFLWNGTYYLIVCGVHDVRAATSTDFETWTQCGPILKMKAGVDPESPSIVRYNDTFYLFVCGWNGVWDRKDIQGAYQHKTYVYQSDNPLKFELENEVAVLDAHAPEIFQDEAGDWFISSVEWPHRGVSIARLVWE